MKVKDLKEHLEEFADDLEVVFRLPDEEETGTQHPYCVADYMQKQLIEGGRDDDGRINFNTIYLHEAEDTSREVLFVSLTSEF